MDAKKSVLVVRTGSLKSHMTLVVNLSKRKTRMHSIYDWHSHYTTTIHPLPGFSPKGVREVQHHSDGGPFFFYVVKT